MSVADDLRNEGHLEGARVGKRQGRNELYAELADMYEQGVSFADVMLKLEAEFNPLAAPSATAHQTGNRDITGTLQSIAAIKAGKANPDDLAAQTLEIMRARRAGTHEEPVEQAAQLTDDEAATQTIELLKARRGG